MAVDAALVANMKQIKTTPMSFVFVAKGNEGKLILDKKKISNKVADEAKKKCGGGNIVRGRCKFEDGLLVFEVGKEVSPTLPALTKKIIKQDAAMTYEVEYRIAADLAAEESGAEAPAPGAPPAPGAAVVAESAAAPAAQPAAAEPAAAAAPATGAEVLKRLNSMAADIKAALVGPNKVEVQKLFVKVNGQIKTKEFAAANATLDVLGPLVANTGAAAAAPAAAPAAPPTAAPSPSPANDAALAAEWERRMIELEPKVRAAQKTRAGEAKWMMLFMNAQDLGSEEEEFARALAVVDKIEGLLNAPPSTSASGELSVFKLGKVRVEWIDVRSKAMQEIERFKQILQDEYQDDPKEQTALANAIQRLTKTGAALNEELADQLDRVLNADTAQRPQQLNTAKSVLARFVNFLESDELMSVIDGNEYAPDMLVAEPLRRKLQEIAAALA